MSSCYRRTPNASISAQSDRRLHRLCFHPISVRAPLRDGIRPVLRSVANSRILEAAVALSLGGGWPSRMERSVAAGCCGSIGAVIGEMEAERRRKAAQVAVAAAATVVLGTGNRVLYKLALVPLKEYPFFLAQFATFG